MDDAKKQIVDIIKNNTNILVTVSVDPSVDELSAALGLTVLLNNLDKRATAVFSGAIPPAITFLEPDKTFEGTADSLRDFIIALDKEKADHLRYKVDGDVVKIFITPYKTTLSQNDLEFSQGDYNVEVVLALGVKDQDHLDKALEAHGKILHDATVLTITAGADTSSLGSLDWHDGDASSLSEMVAGLADGLKEEESLLDEQIATAFLTGIVSATDRFSNDRTSSRAMTIAAQLMAAGANQQLIAAKLEEAHDIGANKDTASVSTAETAADQPKDSDAELTISRSERAGIQDTGKQTELVIQPLSDQPTETTAGKPAEDQGQLELEKELAELTVQPTGTMADIENELKQAAADTAEVATLPQTEEIPQQPAEESAPVYDTGLPELSQLDTTPTVPEVGEQPELPALPQLDGAAPQIMNDHATGTFSDASDQAPPLNSIQNNPNDGEPTIDPFNPPLEPTQTSQNDGVGTPEGAALLASEPEPAAPLQAPITIPQLPPLPPLPPDMTQTPLPPPPPSPPTGLDQPIAVGQSGAITGDVFGDGNATPVVSQGDTPSTEPGQFKIPGQ